MRRGRELKARTSSLPGSPLLFDWFRVGPVLCKTQSLRIIRASEAGPPPWGGREGLETCEAFVSRKAFWTKGPTRASLATVGLRCLVQGVSRSRRSFARLRASKRPELVGPSVALPLATLFAAISTPSRCRAAPSCSRAAGPFSSLQRTPLRRTCATRSHRRGSGRVGRTSSERSPYSHQKCSESRKKDVPRAVTLLVVTNVRVSVFSLQFSVFSFGGLSIHDKVFE